MTEEQVSVPASRSFLERLVAALKLDPTVFEEVEHDESALPQAAAVVALAALARALMGAGVEGAGGMVSGLVAGFVGWLVATALVWFVGVRMFKHTSDFGELLRTLGFASAPQIALVLAVLPLGPLRALLMLAVFAFAIAAFVIAVRQALDVTTGRALIVCVLALILNVAVGFVLALVLALVGL
jgi:hypothetical protein